MPREARQWAQEVSLSPAHLHHDLGALLRWAEGSQVFQDLPMGEAVGAEKFISFTSALLLQEKEGKIFPIFLPPAFLGTGWR